MTDARAEALGASANTSTEVTRAACMALKAEARAEMGPEGRLYVATDGYKYSVPPRRLPWEAAPDWEEPGESSADEAAWEEGEEEEQQRRPRGAGWRPGGGRGGGRGGDGYRRGAGYGGGGGGGGERY